MQEESMFKVLYRCNRTIDVTPIARWQTQPGRTW
jgi:hypothetical protein